MDLRWWNRNGKEVKEQRRIYYQIDPVTKFLLSGIFVFTLITGIMFGQISEKISIQNEMKTLGNKVEFQYFSYGALINEMQKRFKIRSGFRLTAYSNDPISINVPKYRDGYTATGYVARPGLCASDWNILPPGTIIYHPLSGWCEIQDRGGEKAMAGKSIDIFKDTYGEARAFGVKRNQEIIVLEN